MALPPRRPEELVGTVFTGRSAIGSRLLTKQQSRGPAWRRLFRGVYADAELPLGSACEWHADGAQARRDRRRLNQLVAAVWTVLHGTADRLRHEFDMVVRELAACLATRA